MGLAEARLNLDLRSHIPDSRHIARRVRTSIRKAPAGLFPRNAITTLFRISRTAAE
jgi:hypothetical protein